MPLFRLSVSVPTAAVLALGLTACAPEPPYADMPAPGTGASRIDSAPARAVVEDTTRAGADAGLREEATGSRASGACGRLVTLRDYIARLEELIAVIEQDGVTDAERTDLLRAYSRLHGARAAEVQARFDVDRARYRLEALTGGDIRASDLPACE
jgi:hypothetical protein